MQDLQGGATSDQRRLSRRKPTEALLSQLIIKILMAHFSVLLFAIQPLSYILLQMLLTLVVLIEYDHASVTFDLVISECTYVKNACPNI